MNPEVIGYDEQVAAMGEEPQYVLSAGEPYEVVSGADWIESGAEWAETGAEVAEVGADQDLQRLLAVSGADDYVGYETEVGASPNDAAMRRRAIT